jgi:hypothetical protein
VVTATFIMTMCLPILHNSCRGFFLAKHRIIQATRQLMVIPKEDFADCFEKWEGRWDKRVISQGQYFEGD